MTLPDMPDATMLRIHDFLPASYANGPGCRAVLFMQGCSLACPGCFNPQTHSFEQGQQVTVAEMAKKITDLSLHLEGITVSGGEPLQQANSLGLLLAEIRQRTNLSILIFTGFTMEEIQQIPGAEEVVRCTDVLIAGRFVEEQRVARGLIGSANKVVHCLTSRYRMEDLADVADSEIIVGDDGTIIISGIDPPLLGQN